MDNCYEDNSMKKFPKFICGIFMTVCAPFTIAHAAPLDQSCALARAVLSNNSGVQMAGFKKALVHWYPDSSSPAYKKISEEIVGKNFVGGALYLVGQLGDELVDHLVTFRQSDGGVAYMRLQYEWFPKQHRIQYFVFEQAFNIVMKDYSFALAPKKLACE